MDIYRNDKEVVFLDPNTEVPTQGMANLCKVKMTGEGIIFLGFLILNNILPSGQYLVSSPNESVPINLVIRSLKSNGQQKVILLVLHEKIELFCRDMN